MKANDKKAFAELMAGVHSFYRQELTQFALGVWWRALELYSLEAVAKALDLHVRDPKSGQFPPKPADVVRLLDGTHEDRALVAWGKVLEAIQRVGQYQSVAFDDPAIHATVVDLGGWPKICACTLDELGYLQKRFCDLHGSYSRRGAFEFPRWLVGVAEAENRAGGYAVPAPVLIGEPEAARRVIAGGVDGAKTKITQIGAEALRLLTN